MVNFLKLPKATFNLRGNFQAQFVKMLFPEPWRGRGNGDGSGGGSGKGSGGRSAGSGGGSGGKNEWKIEWRRE